MKLGLAALALSLLFTSAAYASPVSLTFTGSGYEVPISSDGAGNYTLQPGSCTPDGAATSCIWQGTYTSIDPNYSSGTFTISTTRTTLDEWLTGIQASGDPNTLDITGAGVDVNMTINLLDTNTGSSSFNVITNGVFQGSSLAITGYQPNTPSSTTLFCNPGYCSIAAIADAPPGDRSFEGEALASFTFDDVNFISTVPEPSSLALIGTGALGMVGALRRRFNRAA